MQLETAPGRIGRRLVRALDARLRRAQGAFVFSEDPDCIFRISLVQAETPLRFANGASVAPGDQLIVIHFWNERLPSVPPQGPDLRWARTMHRQAVASLHLLARYLDSRPDLAAVRAVGSDVAGFLNASAVDTGAVFPRLGFEMQRPLLSASPWQRFLGFWESLYSWLLVWTYNPATLRGKAPWNLERFELWMPRTVLEERYGEGVSGHEAPQPTGEPEAIEV